jgi:hypothetical protein
MVKTLWFEDSVVVLTLCIFCRSSWQDALQQPHEGDAANGISAYHLHAAGVERVHAAERP